ncbi:M3 family metallopeptidase [Fictibacillus phosphorivorans]|uniref:M3 family metallopeptidase n=1 Tax=Fictibacillus phosphorivorans TaxID=1221500 RepID=UPI003CEB5F07
MDTFKIASRWNLNVLPCGSNVNQFFEHLREINKNLAGLEEHLQANILYENDLKQVSSLIKQIESAESFYYCLTTEDIFASQLTSINGEIASLKSKIYSIIATIQESVDRMSTIEFTDWSKPMKEVNFLKEITLNKKSKKETAVSNLVKESLSALEDLYQQVRHNMKIDLDQGEEQISLVKAMNLALSHSEASQRTHIFQKLNESIKSQANIFSSIYNQMIGLRLHDNKVKAAHFLDDSLSMNGISRQTLDAMWNAIDIHIEELSSYLKTKSKESMESISWHTLMTSSQKDNYQLSYAEAIDEIVKSLQNIDDQMYEFVKDIIAKGWVDVELRQNKSNGGFCAPFISEGESRISLSYDNSFDSARRLAHELGHAWHFNQMKDTPTLRFSDDTFEMTMAETSSIFFETVFVDHMINNTKDLEIKKTMLGSKIERSLNYLMSIRAAFLFEENFYRSRENQLLNAEQIEAISLNCQEIAYGGNLSDYEPFIWIKYGQFYQANVPFYNYPYTFGFLLSIGLLESAKSNPVFKQTFKNFLSETGSLPLEQLFKKHFHVELANEAFWVQSVKSVTSDIKRYIELT